MTVKELIERLECFDDNAEVVIGMKQTYGSNFAMNVCDDIGTYMIEGFWDDEEDYKAVVITEGRQIGVVEY